jgi:hypothetical protein
MKIKVYNDNGIAKITKIDASGREVSMFSSLQPGQYVEIDITPNIAIQTTYNQIDVEDKTKG